MLTRQFADTVRREYRAVGIHVALSPQADLATEPRWPRNDGTFGEDPELAAAMVKEYVLGLQGDKTGPDSVLAVVKHWVGYPATPDGYDGHNYYGRESILAAEQLSAHVKPFEAAFAAGVAGVMPTYSVLKDLVLDGKPVEPVAAGYSRELLTDLLRGRHGFGGLVLSDWAITNDCDRSCRTGEPPQAAGSIATSWGVESLSRPERFAKGVNAGLDQFGGTTESGHLAAAVNEGLVSAARLDESVARILEQKFVLGLFERPFVDAQLALQAVGAPSAREAALHAQHRSLVLLRNDGLLPLALSGRRVYLHGVDAAVATAYGMTVVASPREADLAIVRVGTPFETLHPGFFFGRRHHEGRLDFRPGEAGYEAILAASVKPTVMVVNLDRPAILTAVQGRVAAIVGEFGASDRAVLDVLTGKAAAQGRLPFALPASMDDVVAQSPAEAHDVAMPLFPFGHGLSFR